MLFNKSSLVVFGLLLVCSFTLVAADGDDEPTNFLTTVVRTVRNTIEGVHKDINGFIDDIINYIVNIPQRIFTILAFIPKYILKLASYVPLVGIPARNVVKNLEKCEKQNLAQGFGKAVVDGKNCFVKPVTNIVQDASTILKKLEEVLIQFSAPENTTFRNLLNVVSKAVDNALPIAKTIVLILPRLGSSLISLPFCIGPSAILKLIKEAAYYVLKYVHCVV